ncbi:MAG: hypothetical protein QXJ19_03945 [Candidatus Bathyarchaeia archaeon]|nr:hypothetical protein [Candidatus Bathyarchaeota archaeon]
MAGSEFMNKVDSISIMCKHYSRSDVQKEIIDFCRGRWIAIHYLGPSGNLVLRRYISGKPIKVESTEDLKKLCRRMRSIYATANVYRRIEGLFDLNDQRNVIYCTPTWDIDGNLSSWTTTIRVARKIVEFLFDWGVKESLYVKWSGNGCHIHLHERGISEGLLEKYSPLDIGYAIVEYVNTKVSHDLIELSIAGEIKVENKMDPARIFTCPLSLHRELDVVCICMKPEDLENFSPSWINTEDFRHDPSWREFKEGEVDKLAEAAYKAVGGYPLKPKRGRRKAKPLDRQIMEWLQRD